MSNFEKIVTYKKKKVKLAIKVLSSWSNWYILVNRAHSADSTVFCAYGITESIHHLSSFSTRLSRLPEYRWLAAPWTERSWRTRRNAWKSADACILRNIPWKAQRWHRRTFNEPAMLCGSQSCCTKIGMLEYVATSSYFDQRSGGKSRSLILQEYFAVAICNLRIFWNLMSNLGARNEMSKIWNWNWFELQI